MSAQGNHEKNREAESYFEKSRASLKNGDAHMAVKYAEKAIFLRNDVVKYHVSLGDACVLKLQGIPESERHLYAKKIKKAFETAVRLDGNNIAARIGLASFHLRAPVSWGGNKEEAKVQAAEILKLDRLRGHLLFSNIYLVENDVKKGEESAEKAYRLHLDFKKKHPKKNSSFNRDILNSYGYRFLKERKIDKAIKLFKMNVTAYPDYFNVYDSLAEAYTIKGETGQAIKCYERSLELNPRSNNYEIDVYKQGRRNLEDLKKRESDK
jgi:tetratricopeptide (TPR) repeat protein